LKKLLFLLSFIFSFLVSCLAQDSCFYRISLLTCAPGEELYSTFGHTALRVQNKATGDDIVYNYGTFEFGPDFYTKFITGKLLYFLSVENFNEFIYTYQVESRSIQEQELQLSCAEKEKLLAALQTNAQERNRYYKYDFLIDNCTTRAKDIVAANAASPVTYKNILPAKAPSFRDLIHSYLDAGGQDWSKLGIDILLGAKLDRKATNQEAMFLPDYLLKGFDSASTGGHPLVSAAQTILQMPSPLKETTFFSPALVFTALLVILVLLSFVKKPWARKIFPVFDFLFFFLLGIAGLLLLFMWFGTDHTVCKNNYNLLWAFPPNVVMAFFVHRKKRWATGYFFLLFWFSILLAVAWFFLPQQMNMALYPVLLLIIFRTWYLFKMDYNEERN
jgi:hypothetical protein